MNFERSPLFHASERFAHGVHNSVGFVVHVVVTNCGGHVSFEGTSGKGTSFYVYLPRATAASMTAERAAERIPGGSERILIVDDEESIARLAVSMLRDLGYAVVCNTSGLAALQLFMADPQAFDLVT
jgi:hypothetical protein